MNPHGSQVSPSPSAGRGAAAALLSLLCCGLLAASGAGCGSKTRAASGLSKVSGDGQVGVAGQPLGQPLVVKVTDNAGNGVAGISVVWTVSDGGGSLDHSATQTDSNGVAQAIATLGSAAMGDSFQATVYGVFGSPVIFQATRTPFKLSYSDPAAGGKLRLVRNASSSDVSVVLDLVVGAGAPLSGYAAGFNLPLDDSKVGMAAMGAFVPGKALDPGSDPVAAAALLPKSGPLKGVLVVAQSQKASGKGAIATDTALSPGTVLLSVRLDLLPGATPGVVFDGTDPAFKLPSGGLRSRIGTAIVNANELAIGKLEVVK